MMKLLCMGIFFSCQTLAMLIPIFNDDYESLPVAPTVPKSPPSLVMLGMQAIARDRQNFSLEAINCLPAELALPIMQMRDRA